MNRDQFNNIDIESKLFISFSPNVINAKTDYGILLYDDFDEWNNQELKSRYLTKKQSWMDENKILNEMILYHGCPIQESIENIKNNGFNIEYLGTNTRNKGLYGAGIYFSKIPVGATGYSVEHNSDGEEFYKIIVSKVLVGTSFNVPTPELKIIKSELKKNYTHEGKSLEKNYDSHTYANEVVIFNTNQILPLGMLHLHVEPIHI